MRDTAYSLGTFFGHLAPLAIGVAVSFWLRKRRGGDKLPGWPIIVGLVLTLVSLTAPARSEAPEPSRAAEGDPVNRVRSFITAASKDRAAAAEMVAGDAQFGAGDVGGPFDMSLVDEITKDCSFDTTAPSTKPLGMAGRSIVIVEVQMTCRSEGDSTNSQPVDFMVENDKIAGLYLPVKSGLQAQTAKPERG